MIFKHNQSVVVLMPHKNNQKFHLLKVPRYIKNRLEDPEIKLKIYLKIMEKQL
jgi:hypothetical protein